MSNYRKGSDFERFVKYQLEEEGYFVVRSAGSHGPVDLVAIRGGSPTMLIQCKTAPPTGAETVALDMFATNMTRYLSKRAKAGLWFGFATPTGDHPRVKLTRSGG